MKWKVQRGCRAEPGQDLRVLVGAVVVEDGVDQLAGRHRRLDGVEEAQELLVAVPLHAAAQHRAVEHVQRGEQRGRAVALVVVGRGRRPALLHRQPGLGALEGLDLGFLVDREHDRVRRRVHVEPDHVAQLGDERRVPGELEGAHPVRGEPVRLPDALHRAQGDAGRLGHHPAGPVGRLARRLAEGQLDHAVDQPPAAAAACRASWSCPAAGRRRPPARTARASAGRRAARGPRGARSRRCRGRRRRRGRPWPARRASAGCSGPPRSPRGGGGRPGSRGWRFPGAWRRVPQRPTERNAMSASGH